VINVVVACGTRWPEEAGQSGWEARVPMEMILNDVGIGGWRV